MDVVEARPGRIFPEVIKSEVVSCDYFLALIGHHWFSNENEPGPDYVLLEIQWALETKRAIIPILVDGANMPSAASLPPEIRQFANYEAFAIRSESFSDDVNELLTVIDGRHLSSPDLKVMGLSFVQQKGWTGADLAAKLEKLDYEVIENLEADNEASPEALGPIFEEYSETWRILIEPDTEDIVGYWRFVPLVDDMYEKARSGRLHDNELTRETMKYLIPGGTYDIYIAAMCIRKRYRNFGDRELFLSFLDVLLKLARAGILIDRVCANGLNSTGRKICAGVGLDPKVQHETEGIMYEAEMTRILKYLQRENKGIMVRYQELLTLYGVKEIEPLATT